MTRPLGIGDFLIELKEAQMTIKGDVPGHEFHGNQYEGGGGSSGDTSGLSHEERRQKMIEEAEPLISKQRAIKKQMLQKVGGLEGYQDDWRKARAHRGNKKLLQEHDALTNEIVSLEDKWLPSGKEIRISDLPVEPRFSGETLWDAIVSNLALDIVEEEELKSAIKDCSL